MVLPQEDMVLVNLLQLSDRKGASLLVEKYGKFIYQICYRVLLKTHETEEATQDSVLKIVKSIHSFDTSSSFKAWCYTISFRTAIDYKRKMKSHINIDTVLNVVSDSQADEIVKQNETKWNLATLLSCLNDEDRQLISLYYLEEKNIKEVSDVTKLSISNVKIKLFRARKLLANHISKFQDFKKI